MIAGIIGDVIGSVYEGSQWGNKDLSLIKNDTDKSLIKPILKNLSWVRQEQCWTDDTLCTLALYEAYIKNEDYTKVLQYYCKKYQSEVVGFGKQFNLWVDNPVPYESFGNGSLMRIGFIPNLPLSLEDKLRVGFDCTKISHNHIDSFKAVNDFIIISQELYLSQNKNSINRYLSLNNYSKTVEDLHNEFRFENSAKETLNQALVIVLESTSIEDVLVNSCYVGGDTDTLACIASNLASKLYKLPNALKEYSLNTIKPFNDLNEIINNYNSRFS